MPKVVVLSSADDNHFVISTRRGVILVSNGNNITVTTWAFFVPTVSWQVSPAFIESGAGIIMAHLSTYIHQRGKCDWTIGVAFLEVLPKAADAKITQEYTLIRQSSEGGSWSNCYPSCMSKLALSKVVSKCLGAMKDGLLAIWRCPLCGLPSI